MLTPLEKELLACVEELTTTCEQSVAALERSEAELKRCEALLRKTSANFSSDLTSCVLASAKLQQELLNCWMKSLSDHGHQARWTEALVQSGSTLRHRIADLEASASQITSG
ncbi:hypothetical protein A8B78_08005 [Jannaschia sp. EhC01]|nr:hypothetical protein A8B78_08005 [Jannaschia sp. EhC01]